MPAARAQGGVALERRFNGCAACDESGKCAREARSWRR
jgi:hypothetical protein